MADTEATDHLEDAQEMLRGASQILQALAASPTASAAASA